jgi:hypothetical protein
MLPPLEFIAVEFPAAIVRLPPFPLFPSPTPTYIEPPFPPVAAPVRNERDPVSPELDVPVLKSNIPEAPVPPEFAVDMLAEPDVAMLLMPLLTAIFPPRLPNPRPAVKVTLPPRPKFELVPEPAVISTAPPELRAAEVAPAAKRTLPPLPEVPSPTNTVKLPPAPLIEVPVARAIDPVAPFAAVPVERRMVPLTPCKPESAVVMRNDPLDDFSP